MSTELATDPDNIEGSDGGRTRPSGDGRSVRTQSRDGRSVAFVRRGPPSEIWLASAGGGGERRLLAETASDKPEGNLTGFEAPQVSPDGRTVFFLCEAWATSAAVHAIDVATLKERFVVDANALMVIPSGRHAGQLFVYRHRYKVSPGEGYHSYEWCGVVDTRGRAVRTLSTDGTMCPDYEPEDRARVEAALGIAPGGPATP